MKNFKFKSIFNKNLFKNKFNCRNYSNEPHYTDNVKEPEGYGKVKIFLSTSNDPFFNLSTENYIFRHFDLSVPVLFMYKNSPNVIIGKHQNPWVECQVQQMEKDNVLLVRRDSGGGAVYQDLGNTCFSFISMLSQHDKIKNTNLLCRTLKKHFDVDATGSGRNDIVVGERKISGSAYKYTRDKALHHGTMLIDVNLGALEKYLTPNKKKLESKATTSVRSRVINLSSINKDINHSTFCNALLQEFWKEHEATSNVDELNFDENMKIDQIRDKYYSMKSSVWDETPQFNHQLETRFDWGLFTLHIDVLKGDISDVKIFSDVLFPEFVDSLASSLKGKGYHRSGIVTAMVEAEKLLEGSDSKVYLKPFSEWLLNSI
eukprot:TRINITY_DN11864_c0_g1_i1.p1 TRINITY_DN11864_c0_g1~~TRINITY_DN11864_c0_g1_i1.p1  ORF type:complete len:374 (+),score=79.72 TRINITY_DN11864_c0_g1_i1:79-1200(+)